MRLKCLACLAAIVWAMTSPAHAQSLPKVGWSLDMSKHEVGKLAEDGFSREFYPSGQTAENWKERFLVRKLGSADGDADARFAEQETQLRSQCPDFSAQTLPFPGEKPANPVRMWNCPRDGDGFGWTAFATIISADGEFYLAQAGKRGASFQKGGVAAIDQADVQRYAEFVFSFAPCTDLTVMSCVPPEAIMGKYGDAPLTPEERTQAADIAARGLALYRQDQLAWHASDYVQQQRLFPLSDSAGFLSIPAEGLAGSTFFFSARSESREAPEVLARIDSDAKGTLSAVTQPDDVPQEAIARWRARHAAMSSKDIRRCGNRVNTVVLPDADGSWWVYVMSAVADEHQVFLGGHNRLHVAADGSRILSIDHSANGCLAVDAVALRAMKSSEGAFFTHLVSPLPWETDVMQSLTYAFPMTRLTSTGVWRIEGDSLRKLALQPKPE